MTPEAKVKAKIKKVLNELGCWYFMPVQTGYGAPTLDFICARNGKIFLIEAKAPGKKPTPRQNLLMGELTMNGIPHIVIDDKDRTVGELALWIMSHSE